MNKLLLLFIFIPVLLFAQDSEDVKDFDYEGIYVGEISKVNYKKLGYETNVKVIITEVGITLESDYSVYKRYAGTYSEYVPTDGWNPGEFLVDLDKSAYDSDGTMMFIVKEHERPNMETLQMEPCILIAVTIGEFNENTTLTIIAQKIL